MFSQKLKQLSTNQFARNVGWLGSAELIQRVCRLGTTVTLARVFTIEEYGMVSAVYTVFDFAMVLGMTESFLCKIIQTDDEKLEEVCNTTFWLTCLMVIALASMQCLLAYPISLFYHTTKLFLPLCVLAIIHLFYPFFLVQLALIDRANQLKVRSSCNASQAIISNLITIVLAGWGLGIWSVVLGMLISYPAWIVITRRNNSWRPDLSQFTLKGASEIFQFSVPMTSVDLLNRIRLYADNLLVTGFLGLEALGIYSFAFNAGLGISQSLIMSLSTAWYPHFCEMRSNFQGLRSRFIGSFKSIFTVLLSVVILQTALAPFYVPIIFSAKWVPAIPLLILICFSAIPFAMNKAASQLLRALGETKLDLMWNFIFSVGFTLILLLVVKQGIFWVAVAVLASQAVAMPMFSWFIMRKFFTAKA